MHFRNVIKFYLSVRASAWCVGMMLLVLMQNSGWAAVRTSTASGGNWNTTTTWVGGVVPLATDEVVIATTGGNTVNLDGARTCIKVTINSGARLNLLTYTLTVNGAWLNNGTFLPSTGIVKFGTASAAINPGSGTANFGTVQIMTATTLTINTPTTLSGSLNYDLPVANNSVTISGSNTLQIDGDVKMILPTSNTRSNTLAVGAGTLTLNGQFKMTATTTASRANVLSVSTGTANLNGGFSSGTAAPTAAPACKLTFTDAGTINLRGSITGGPPDVTPGTGTLNFQTATPQNVWLDTYYNLGIYDGTKTLTGAITVQNQLNIASGTLVAGANNITLSGSGDFFQCTGTFDPGTGLVLMSGASAGNIPGTTFNNLTVTNGTKTVQSGTTVTVNGNWAQNTAVVLDGTANAYVYGLLSGYGTLTMGSGTLSLDSSYTSSGTFTPGTGTVRYVGNGGAVKVNWTYYNLQFDGNRSLTGAVTVNNQLSIGSGATLSMVGSPVNLLGNGNPVVNNGMITSTTGALVFAGTGNQVIGAGIYPRTTLSNGPKTIEDGSTVEISGAFLVDAPLTMEGTGSATVTGATSGAGSITMEQGTLTFRSTFAGATFTPGTGKVIYGGTASQAVRVGVNYYDLELASTVGNSIGSTTMTIANNLVIGSTVTTTSSTNLNVGNDILGTGALTALGVVSLQGDWLHTGTVSAGTSGTIHYSGVNQSVKNFSYYKLTLTGGVKTMNGNITATNLVVINADTEFNLNGFTLELQGGTVNAMNNLGTLTGNGKVLYSLATAQTINGSTFYDLEFTGGPKTIATGASIETLNDWIVSSTVTMSSTQNATVGRDLIHNASGFIDQGSGIITIGRNWVHNGGTFDAAQGTVVYAGANQTIAPFTYNTLTCAGSGVKSITGNILLNGILTINPGVTFDRASYTVTLPFNGTPFVNNGTLTGNGKFFYTGTGTQNIAPGSYYDLEFNTGIKSLPAGETIEVLNDWTVSSTTNFGANTIVTVGGAISGGGALTLGNGTLTLAGAWNKTGTFTAGNTGLIHFNGSDQTIPNLDYYTLQISNSGTKSLGSNITVRDVLTLNSGSTLALGSYNLTLSLPGTPFVNNGNVDPGSSTVLYTASGTTNIAAANYYNLNAGGGDRSLPASGTVGIAGSFVPGSGTYTVTGSTVNFNGAGAQVIPPFIFNKLILSGSGAKTIQTATSVTVTALDIEDGPSLDLPGSAQLNIIN